MIMNNITQIIRKQEKKGRLVIPYVMVADGGFEATKKTVELYVRSGAKIIELGLPFSDPVADGPIIQASGNRALKHQHRFDVLLEFIVSLANAHDVSFIIMTYLNPVLHYGIDAFIRKINHGNINGLIIPDLPYERFELFNFTANPNLELIPLVALNSDLDRVKNLDPAKHPFLYLISVTGTTGSKNPDFYLIGPVSKVLKSHFSSPIIVGFGVKNTGHVKTLTNMVDGVVIASELIRLNLKGDYDQIQSLISSK